jgi:CdiI immunity protein
MEDSDGGNEWRNLRTLFAAYLHQDFIEDYGDEWGAVRRYCADATKSDILAAADELKNILDSTQDEHELEDIADRLGSFYFPPGAGQTYRGWMTDLERFLRTEAT